MNTSRGAISFDCFTSEQVKEINKVIRKNISQKENASSPAKNVNKIGKFSYVDCGPLIDLLHPWLYNCQSINRNYFQYDIYWNFHIEILSYNVYGTGGKYGWHVDSNSTGMVSPKLTCLLNLSEEPYEGGEFCILGGVTPIEFTSGMGLVMTSLIGHKVTPVTKGERITLTYWAHGPSWK